MSHLYTSLYSLTSRRVMQPLVWVIALIVQTGCATVRPNVEAHAFGKIDPDVDQRVADLAVTGKSPSAGVHLIDAGLSSINRDLYDVLGTVLVEEKPDAALRLRNAYWVNDFESRRRYKYCAAQAPLKAVTLGVWNIVPLAWFCMAANPDSSSQRLRYMLPYVRRATEAMGGDTALLLNSLNTESVQTLGTGWHNENLSIFQSESAQVILRDTGVQFLILRERTQKPDAEVHSLD